MILLETLEGRRRAAFRSRENDWLNHMTKQETEMKTYLAVFTGNAVSRKKSGWDDLAPEKRKALEEKGMAAWGKWMADNAGALVFEGGPLGKTKRVSKSGTEDISNAMAGLVVIKAESHEAAAKKFENHPHFTIFPGEAVEIMEVLPIPGR